MGFLRYIGRRLIFLPIQLLGVMLVTFLFVRSIPGDPARLMAGPLISQEGLELIRERMGLTGPLPLQFIAYIRNVFQGDLGYSWYTGNPVMTDIIIRLPATLELIILSLVITFFVMVPLGMASISPRKGLIRNASRKVLFGYGMAAGAFPDFWLGLLAIFVFYVVLGWAPAPVGQLDIGLVLPPRVTGMLAIDTVLAGDWAAFKCHIAHLILPVLTLTFCYGVVVMKIAMVTAMQLQKSGFIDFAKVCGLPLAKIQSYVTRATYPSVATTAAIVFAFLIGGAVLVETVFSWGGFGQYAVQAVINSDYAATQGVVLVAAILNLIAYLLVDLVYFWVDPRIKTLG